MTDRRAGVDRTERDSLRRYWASPTGVVRAKEAAPGLVEFAESTVNRLADECDRLEEGLRRLKNQDYDAGYTAEAYAEAILTGHEPTGESTVDA